MAVPGTVVGSTLVHAPNLGWHDVDLSVLWPHYESGPGWFAAGNDATFAAVAEARRGAAAGAGAALHLYLDAGVGGAMLNAGRAVLGAHGTAGEFGRMPFGDPGLRCACGAMGCWNTSLNGYAVARLLGDPPPTDEVGYLRGVLAAGRAASPARSPRWARSPGRSGAARRGWSTRSTRTWSRSAASAATCSRWPARPPGRPTWPG